MNQQSVYILYSKDGNPYTIGVFEDFKRVINYLKGEQIIDDYFDNSSEDDIINYCRGMYMYIEKVPYFK